MANKPSEAVVTDGQSCGVPNARGRILVVDDVKLLCEGLVRLLRQAQIEGVVAHGVADALQLVEKHHFDCVITDVMMPGLSGVELVEELGRIRPDLKCIVMTGYATRDLINRLKAARNVIAIQTKPLDVPRLIDKVSSLLGPK